MLDIKYSIVIEATDDPSFFTFYSSDLAGFSGVGSSIEDCVYKAKWGIEDHIRVLREEGLPIPELSVKPVITIKNEDLAKVG